MADRDDKPPVTAPRETVDLVGHTAAEAALLEAWRSARLPHGWLFTGPEGIGKATLAYRFARFVLADGGGAAAGGLFGDAMPPAQSLGLPPEHPVFRRVAAGGHLDLMTLDRRDKTVISVDQVRAAVAFLGLTPGEGAWRVVIVDCADDMNVNAANALLKVLEEPPDRALLVLVSHAPGSLPATIRSRCCRLALRPLGDDDVKTLLGRMRPDLGPGEAAALARLGEGSIGRALRLGDGGGLDVYRQIVALAEGLPRLDGPMLHALADRLGRAGADAAFTMTMDLLRWWIARLVRAGAVARGARLELPGGDVVPGETEAARRVIGGGALERWVDVWEKITRQVAQAEALNLDRRQVVLGAFHALEEGAR